MKRLRLATCSSVVSIGLRSRRGTDAEFGTQQECRKQKNRQEDQATGEESGQIRTSKESESSARGKEVDAIGQGQVQARSNAAFMLDERGHSQGCQPRAKPHVIERDR